MLRRSRFRDDQPETAFAAATTRIIHNVVDLASRMHATPMSALLLVKRLPGCACRFRAMVVPSNSSRRPQAWQANCSTAIVTNNSRNLDLSNSTSEFYTEQKWCDQCNGYVRFMMSVNHSYCIECGGRVRLFNRNDSASFQETVQRHKWQAS